MQFKPKLIPTIFTSLALIVLLSLSYWQFQRLGWKQAIINEIKQKSELVPISLENNQISPKMLYRKVKVKGIFDHAKEIHMYGGSRQFKGEPGYYIITAMKLADGSDILINRGWVPEKLKDAAKRPDTLVQGEVEIMGNIMPAEQKTLYIHDNQPKRNLWFYINLDEIRDYLGLSINDFYVLANDNPNILPRGRDLEINLHNNHLGYALTWLFSAVALLIIYIQYHRKS